MMMVMGILALVDVDGVCGLGVGDDADDDADGVNDVCDENVARGNDAGDGVDDDVGDLCDDHVDIGDNAVCCGVRDLGGDTDGDNGDVDDGVNCRLW